MDLNKTLLIGSWILQVVVAVILAQTLFFKFSGAEESVYIFKTLGLEPWGRIGSGIAELIAVILLLYPRTTTIGAILALGVICGAIMSHLTKRGIEVQGDGGLLFGLAIVVFVGSLAILVIRREQIPVIGSWLFGSDRPVTPALVPSGSLPPIAG
ncbi:DoxX family protein [Humisphaera borealis]|uniref:DoxX family protein n=1 Tax=Humisphaera borealis TaxID=2807512 RepID=A0A7M2WVN1_9BACT|nr:DoxX family protein [Humisphaera borealis]QOV89545.1 DoxX family protein [Humisphaera borealis]